MNGQPDKSQVMQELQKRGYTSEQIVEQMSEKEFQSRMIANGVDTRTGRKIDTDQSSSIYQELIKRGYSDEQINIRKKSSATGAWGRNYQLVYPSSIEKTPSFIERMKSDLPEIAGSTGFGIAGTIAGGPLLGVPMAALGGGFGNAMEQLYQHSFTPGKAPRSTFEATKRIAGAGAEQGAYELVGFGAGKALGKVAAPFVKKMGPQAKITQETLGKYMPTEKSWARPISKMLHIKPLAYTPAEATEVKILDVAQNIVEGSMFGGQSLMGYQQIRNEAIEKMVKETVDSFGEKMSQEEVGRAIIMALDKKLSPDRMVATQIYNSLENEIGDVARVNTLPLKKIAENRLRLTKLTKGIGDDPITEKITQLDDTVPWEAAQTIKTDLFHQIGQMRYKDAKNPMLRLYSQYLSDLTGSMSQEIRRIDPELYSKWLQANKLWKKTSEEYQGRFVKRLLQLADPSKAGDPESIVKQLAQPGKMTRLKTVWNILDKTKGGESTKKLFKSWLVSDAIKKSVDDKTGEVIGDKLFGKFFGKAGYGEEMLSMMYTKEEIQSLQNLAMTLQFVQKGVGKESPGKMLIQLAQGSAAANLVLGFGGKYGRVGSTAVLVSPAMLGRMMTNPIISRWLTTGLIVPRKSIQESTAFVSRLSGMLDRIDKEIEKEKINADIINGIDDVEGEAAAPQGKGGRKSLEEIWR